MHRILARMQIRVTLIKMTGLAAPKSDIYE